MLCPEVWKFTPPDVNVKTIDGSLKNESSEKHVLQTISKHYFNHLISLVVPDTGPHNISSNLTSLLNEDCDYYRIQNVNISEFVDHRFIEGYVNKGQLYILSIDTHIDTDNCLALTPCGKLILSLLKETYQELGLEGKLSHFCKKEESRFVVHIDLKSELLKPGKKYYDRVKWCLSNNLKSMPVILTWIPNETSICPSSIAKYFDSLNYQVSLSEPKLETQLSYNVQVPLFDTNSLQYCSTSDLIEWIGIHSIGTDFDMENYDYLSSYQTPEEKTNFGQVLQLKATGFYSAECILRIFNEIRSYLASRPHLPWISLHIQGFDDSPVSWGLKEHQYYTNGDNLYTIVLKSDDHFILQTVISSNKRPK